MPSPFSADSVQYDDGTPQTVSQYATDVTAFLMWAAEPHLEDRKKLGFRVILYLLVLAALLYLVKRKVWARIEH
jgi:ubiquinol-cytochrome c reductase cytochrome c1 subunit